MKKFLSLISVVGVAFLASGSAAAYHGFSDVSTLELSSTSRSHPGDDPQPDKMTCTILAAWTSSGQSVPVEQVRLMAPANRKKVAVGLPCEPHGKSCGLAVDTITGEPLEAWVSGC